MRYITFVSIENELHSFTVYKSLDGVVYYLTRFWGKSSEVSEGFVRNFAIDEISDHHRTLILDDNPRAILHLRIATEMSDFGHVHTTLQPDAGDGDGDESEE